MLFNTKHTSEFCSALHGAGQTFVCLNAAAA